jgi:RNA 2',3'-cyclic 3'-phosphodiesterase
VNGDERLRLFCALRLPDDAIVRLVDWQRGELRGGRLVPPENLHVTLAFLGSRPAGELATIAGALRTAAAEAEGVRLGVSGYRETRSVGMLTLDDEGGRATGLAERLHGALEGLGVYRREARPWLPHLTVVRFKDDATRPQLQPTLDSLPREVVPSDAAVFISRLRPDGAQYEVLEFVALGG